MDNDFPAKLKALRLDKKWSQELLADKLNVSRPKIGHWETGRTQPNLEELVVISELFGCTVDYLIDPNININHLLHRYGVHKEDYYNMVNEVKLTDSLFDKLDKDKDYIIYMNNIDKLLNVFYDNHLLEKGTPISDEQLNVLTNFIDNNKDFIKAKLDMEDKENE